MKTALITGVNGQDGSYLAEFLIQKGYTVHGMIRRSSTFTTQKVDHLRTDPALRGRFALHYGDLTDSSSVHHLLAEVQPDEVYNLAAQSHVGISFQIPEYTAQVDALGTLRFLEAIRSSGRPIRFYQASTSELYGKAQSVPQDEDTPFHPRSPYGVAKLFGYWIVRNYREAYGLFACNGILFNHESPRRGKNFVTRKISYEAVRIRMGLQDCIRLGNLSAKRDWGYAPEFVEGMWSMLQQGKPDDYVLATGETRSVREFCDVVFDELGVALSWEGEGSEERAICRETGRVLVRVDPAYYRPTEVDLLMGNPTKAERCLGWKATTRFEALARLMARSDAGMARQGIDL